MPSYPKTIPNQSLTMEFLWIQQWFKRLYDIKEQHQNENYVVFADRSPYSGCFYSRSNEDSQNNLRDLIFQSVLQLKEHGIQVSTIYLSVDRNILWNRIQKRLLTEPIRIQYQEDKIEWMNQVCDWYQKQDWDYTIYIQKEEDDQYYMLQQVEKILGSILNF